MLHGPEDSPGFRLLEQSWADKLQPRVKKRPPTTRNIRYANQGRLWAEEWRSNECNRFVVLLKDAVAAQPTRWYPAEPLALYYEGPNQYYFILHYIGYNGVISLTCSDLQNDEFIPYDEEVEARIDRGYHLLVAAASASSDAACLIASPW